MKHKTNLLAVPSSVREVFNKINYTRGYFPMPQSQTVSTCEETDIQTVLVVKVSANIHFDKLLWWNFY